MPTLKAGRKAGLAMEASFALMTPKIEAGVTDKRDLLDDTVESALKQAKAYLDAEISPADPEYAKKWAIKASLISTALNTQTKVDELELRRMRTDGYDNLMQRMREVLVQRARQMDALEHTDPTPALSAAE